MTRWAVARAGGKAIRVTPSRPKPIERFDALIIGGGADISPTLYNEEKVMAQIKTENVNAKQAGRSRPRLFISVFLWLLRKAFVRHWHPPAQGPGQAAVQEDEARDKLETALIKDALSLDLPLLGICRGMQLINVCCGGTLYQEIAEFYEESPLLRTLLPRKKIEINPETRLHRLFGSTALNVNSLHHQSVKDLGKDLCVAAEESNGIIQAIEGQRHAFVIGVQWHPEYLPQEESQLSLFKELVDAAAQRRNEPRASTLRTRQSFSGSVPKQNTRKSLE